MLSETDKQSIRDAYRAWLAARGFRSRRGQREMIACIARTLAAPADRLAALEAGTGTGKTVAYCLASLPVAATLDKTIVISTATVALQEQVVLRDLPDLQDHTGLQFQFVLAKGRGRYLCPRRLDDIVSEPSAPMLPLFEADPGPTPGITPGAHDTALYQSMLERFVSQQWDGDLDGWPDALSAAERSAITTDHRGCTNNRCDFFRQCPFFKARRQLERARIIVANHDLVLADLGLGGGAILPAPEDCIYIIDEAHHLPEKTQSHFSLRGRLNATVQWLERLDPLLAELHTALQAEAAPMPRFASLRDGLQRDADNALQCLRQLHTVLQQLPFSSDGHGSRDPESATHRFALGVVPEPIAALAAQAVPPLTALADGLSALHEQLAERVDENDPDQDQGPLVAGASADTSSWLGTIGALQSRAANSVALLHDYALGDQTDAPHARWVNRTAFDSELVSTPMEAGGILERVLWSSCHAAICTSATLTAGGRFDRFLQRAGLPAATTTLRIPSPFDYPSIATLHIPAMRHEPSATQQHDQEVAQRLPELLGSAVSALLLFSSWRQLNAIIARLPDDLRPALHVQGEQSKQALLDAHHARIDQGLTSYLAGVASFAEGLDLPDDYCRHVIIVKLPFAAPDAPLDQAMAEWVEARGGNAFYEIAVPDAALRLVQACGRLIRHEGDHGRITLLDRRIVSRRYGRTLLASLPPYRLVVEPADPRREPATPL